MVYLKRFMFLIVFLVLAPIVLVLAPPFGGVFIAISIIRNSMRYSNAFLKFFAYFILCILGFCLGLASDIIIVPLALIFGIPGYLIYLIV